MLMQIIAESPTLWEAILPVDGESGGPDRRSINGVAFHRENHLVERIGWLRAAVLGANDGIISTASLIWWASARHSQSDCC
jgi:VIT1/CCC1 family predicted Fe2+/Mn2+ transporter